MTDDTETIEEPQTEEEEEKETEAAEGETEPEAPPDQADARALGAAPENRST